MISKQFADAADAATSIVPPRFAIDPFGRQLLRSVSLLARGKLARVVGLEDVDAVASTDLGRRSEETLKLALLRAVKTMAARLLGGEEDPRPVLTQIIDLCDGPALAAGQAVSTFPGYQQAARLLLLGFNALDGNALVNVPSPPGTDDRYWSSWVRHRATTAPFVWPNHEEAIGRGFQNPGVSAVLVLPTGAGKTTLASMKIAAAIGQSARVLVLAPTHSLVEQLTADFSRIFPELDTTPSGDVGSASISVMTPERCLALLSFQPNSFEDVSLIVFDEAHLLSNESGTRRSMDAMLAVLMLTRLVPNADLLMLSAMLRNGSQLAGWIEEITGRPCLFFEPLWKPSRQARGVVMYQSSELDSALQAATTAHLAEDDRVGSRSATVRSVAQAELQLTPFGLFGLENNWLNETTADVTIQQMISGKVNIVGKLKGRRVLPTPSVNRVAVSIAHAAAMSGLKSIVFANVKSHTISMARDLRSILAVNATVSDADQELWDDLAVELGGLEHSLNAPGGGVVCHNGLMLRVERMLAERSFRRPDGAQIIVATPTLAQGMNLPADIAILASEKRAGMSRGREPLAAHELMNAAARAGRAGHVANGLVVLVSETVLTFEPESPLGADLIGRLKAILPIDDRSIELSDPLQSILDRLTTGMVEDPDVEYLLNRLRLENLPDSALSIGFVDRSLAGFQARHAGIEGAFAQQVQQLKSLLERRAEESPLDENLSVIAAQTGLTGELLRELETDLLAAPDWPQSISAWVALTFTWLAASERTRRQLFGGETGALAQAAGQSLAHELTREDLLRLESGVQAWISGDPLNAIELALGSDASGKNVNCLRARNLVTKAIPLSITFAVSVIALVAKGIDRELTPECELSLDCVVTGVREGFNSPALIAFAHLEGQRSLRVGSHLSLAEHPHLSALESRVSNLENLLALMQMYHTPS
ncbi:DEAD/DEAH box helicase [Cryobacterium lactosi]|uniref:DEAD/DEAH box helicase n=1 Tax=Cryobacterium lactosi TaxID=1259202 RepID=UPI00141AFE26|nr:DEAD/DEAH box helicase [Cryobacterium lactosi]